MAFVTAYDKYAVKAFEQNAVDYMLKPIKYDRFLKCINKLNGKSVKVYDENIGERGHFFIQYEVKGKIIKIEYKDLIYIEALKNYITIHTNTSKFVTYLTMKEMEENLPAALFVRIHKSFILNISKITAVEGNAVQLSNKKELVMGVSYKDNLLDILKDKTIKTKRT